MTGRSSLGRIYLGAAIELASERAAVAAVAARLDQGQTPYVVFANVQIGGRQIDCIAATAMGAVLVEVKASRTPVRGALNGAWARLDASGSWRPYGNAYQQALGAKNALRDVMSAIKPLGNYYPDAFVVFAGGLPTGSELTHGDFKVRVTSLTDFLACLPSNAELSPPWDLSDWHGFAASLSLAAVSLEEAVGGDLVRAELELLRLYNAAVVDEYGREGDRWLHENGTPAALHDAASNAGGCAVVGPSGCGKTLMVRSLAARLAAAGSPVLLFAAKDFVGGWSKAVRREIALLTDSAPSELIRAMANGPNPVFLIVDGVNELAGSEALALKGLRALARRLDAKIVLTSQTPPDGFDGLSRFQVHRPSAGLKRRIAERTGRRLSDAAVDLLKAVSSGFEAEMIGGVGAALAGEATRLTLIDQFVRVRLGPNARTGAFGLRQLAVALHRELAFSMAESRFDDFMRDAEVNFDTCDAMFAAGLLTRRGGRISFSHEMILNGCAAFGIAVSARDAPEALGRRLSTPLLSPLAGEIITAIEDVDVCRRVLESVTSSELIAAAATGSLGAVAGPIARQLIKATKAAAIAEIEAVGLELDLDSPAHLARWTKAGRRDWTPAEVACLGAMGRLATSPVGLQDYLDLCAAMDARLLAERVRLAPALKAANVGLRSPSFALAYYGFGSEIGFSKLAHHGPRGRLDDGPSEPLPHLDVATLSSGQLHLYLENRHSFFGAEERGRFAEELIFILRNRFTREPYHVQLAALHAVGFAREAPDETLAELTQAINDLKVPQTNWAINSSIIDALKFLGALDEEGEGARDGIRAEIVQALADDADGNDALSLYTRMFDHPFDSIYYEEIHALTDDERHTLYRRALGSSDVKRSLSLRWLADEVAKLDDPADVDLLARFAALPDRSNLFPQEEWGAFTVSLRFLGRHGAALPLATGDSPNDACLSDIRVLVHAAESRRPEDLAQAQAAWARLHALPAGLVVGCLSEVHAALTERHSAEERPAYGPVDLRDSYTADSLRLSRRFVEEAADAEYFHNVPMRERGPMLAFDTLGRFGDRSDIEALRRLGRANRYSSFALAALKALDVSAPDR